MVVKHEENDLPGINTTLLKVIGEKIVAVERAPGKVLGRNIRRSPQVEIIGGPKFKERAKEKKS